MIAEIIKIDPPKKSRNEGEIFIRIYFKLEDGSWAKTDICPGFRNFKRWSRVLKIGNLLGNLEMKDEKTIDADSWPILIQGEEKSKRSLEEFFKLGVFG